MNTVQHLPEQQTFILLKDNEEAGHLKYDVSDGLWNITHTVVNPAFRGQGLARILVDAAIAEAEKRNIRLKADCDYAAAVLAKR
ncbi:N-acetyltransferase [Neisseria sp. Dent CA1/247]|uniref:GNAT family N-acetyltransferase n=1 Tax=Neisseria sp. Dent CA1/247 TaxID=2912675 RepID=UPI001FD303F4|nr:GNAT family N-acetyltransferase [Neisseria sp. Dent CA1/247]UOO77505.1 N-acetyltransferase [Neisseria sp. Dent CA1/247]